MSHHPRLPKLRIAQPVWPLHSDEVLTEGGVALNVITGAVRDIPVPGLASHAGPDPHDPWCYWLGYVRPEVAALAEFLVASAQLKRWLAGGKS